MSGFTGFTDEMLRSEYRRLYHKETDREKILAALKNRFEIHYDLPTPAIIDEIVLLGRPVEQAESDPTGRSSNEPGAKLDAGKPRMELLQDFGLALQEIAKVSTFGANKYSDGGWQHVPEGIKRYTGAMQRHWCQERQELIDTDSGCMHMAQTAWNALARLELMLREMQEGTVERDGDVGE